MNNRYYMKDEVPFQDFSTFTEKTTKNSKSGAIIVIVIFIIIAIVGGLFVLGMNKKSDTSSTVAPTKTPTPTLEPTETPSATPSGSIKPTGKTTPSSTVSSGKLDRATLNVSVLNGSGVVGAGKKISDYLSGLGYIIKTTGNADNFGYEDITVKIKKSKSDYGALLKKDLSTQGSGSAVIVSVDDTIATDAQVIVGK